MLYQSDRSSSNGCLHFFTPCWFPENHQDLTTTGKPPGFYHDLMVSIHLFHLGKAKQNDWLVVSTPLKNISPLGWFFPIYGKWKMFQTTNHKSSNLILNDVNMVVVYPLSMFGFQATSHQPCHFVAESRRTRTDATARSCSHSVRDCRILSQLHVMPKENMVAAVVTN